MVWPFKRKRLEAAPPVAAIEQKMSSVGPLMVRQVLNMPQWPERDFAKMAREGYQQNPIVNACIYQTARAVADIPLSIKKGDDDVDIPELAKLLKRPNPAQDGNAFKIATISDLMLAGEFFAERVDINGKAKELYRWRPDRVAVIPGDDGFTASYKFKMGPNEKTVQIDTASGEPTPILHVKEYNPVNDWRGMPNVDPSAFAIDMHTGALRWNNALLLNGAQPSGALVYAPKEGGDKLSDDQWMRLKAELEESFSGQKNAGKPLLLDGGLDWREMGFSPKDMNFAEGLHESARLICLAFGVPPLIIGIPGDNTFANYSEANKAFYRALVIPLLRQWCRAMTWWIAQDYGPDIEIVPDIDDLDVFSDERAAMRKSIEESTVLTVNEKREMAWELGEVEGGDVLLVSSSMIPLDAAGAPVTGGPEPESGEGDDGEDSEQDDAA